MIRKQSLEETDARTVVEREAPSDALGYWSRRDRWEALGHQVATLRDEAKRRGVPLESLPGARGLVAAFKALGRKVDRRVR
jgi:hypothetical protein